MKAAAWSAPASLLVAGRPASAAAIASGTAGLRSLTQAVRRGDEAAFAEFYDRYARH